MGDGAGKWQDWVGRTLEADDQIDLLRVQALQAVLDRDEGLGVGDALPPLWHWAYFWHVAPQSDLGYDGHAALSDFLPPLALPRRMWAGSRIRFHRPLPIGSAATRRSTIAAIDEKQGQTGPLVFVTLRHEIMVGGGTAIDEEHDIVYRAAPGPDEPPAAPKPAPADVQWQREIRPDPVLLFRYSALTFNGHRIHYDRAFAAGEGYAGLIVHGPLLATLMVDLVRRERPAVRITAFAFRMLAPVFDTAAFTVAGTPDEEGQGATVWIAGPAGELAAKGSVTFANEPGTNEA